jgi:hypothetical protein
MFRKRLEVLEGDHSILKEAQAKALESLRAVRHDLDQENQQVSFWEHCVEESETAYQKKQRLVRPHSQLAQNRAKLACYRKR